MAYQTNGVNYYTPGWNSGGYVPPNPSQPSYPFSYPQQTQYSTIQPPSMPRQINGRTISNEAEIVPNDVPMDGSFSLFPMNDYSCIYAKQWNTDEFTMKSLDMIRKAWANATPDTRKHMKSEVVKLSTEMVV